MDNSEIFEQLSSRISQLLFNRTKGDNNKISKILDEFNSLNYRYSIVRNPTKAVLLINQCCSIIPPEDIVLVPKCCQLLAVLIKSQSISVEGRTLAISIQWCLQALKSNTQYNVDILKALEALLRNNLGSISVFLDSIIEEISRQIQNNHTDDISLVAVQCLEACTVFSNDSKQSNIEFFFHFFDKCSQIFLSFLCVKKCLTKSVIHCKILETCFIGLQNIITLYPSSYLKKDLGLILGIIKTYMLYNIKDVDFLTPEKLMPSTLSLPEVQCVVGREKTGGKVTKQRKQKPSGSNKKREIKRNSVEVDNRNKGYIPATITLGYSSDSELGGSLSISAQIKTSDSDFSDNEGGKLAQLNHSCGKVRQAALNLFCGIINHMEKPVIFSYWTNFIPESSLSGKHNLVTCILKDFSVRGRMCALNALLLLLTSSKPYLTQAESSEKPSSFTPFSIILGLTLVQLHKSLILALNYTSVPVLAMTLKCLAALIQVTPYHRMSNGLITSVIQNVKRYIFHRDSSVQVTALIVMGCIIAFEPVIPEAKQSMIKLYKTELNKEKFAEKINDQKSLTEKEDFDFAQFSSDEEEVENNSELTSMPWLLQICLRNLGVVIDDTTKDENPACNVLATVKLECLQIISAMSRNYFDLILPYLNYITKALELSLMDKYIDVRLHAGRAVDFLGQAMTNITDTEGSSSCLHFWQSLLSGPLASLIQTEQQPTLKAIGCDCIGSVGPQIFQQLPRDKQILCITLLFGCTRDEENSVKGSAVRALALCVQYPSLREDPGFVADTAESILRMMKDENVGVRIKASWSLGSLSDALVLNSKSVQILEDRIPEKILLDLFEASIKSSSDTDKIKTNVVRALGNLLQLMDKSLLKEVKFRKVSEQAFSALVRNSSTGTNMKARWNACYALGNALKNTILYDELEVNRWQPAVFNSLMDLVIGFKNFKVRINAALALSCPSTREHYGKFYVPVWISLLKALENSQNMENFTEYEHRDHLVEQICISIAHLTTLLKKEDLQQIDATVNLYLDSLKIHMHKVLERMVPENSTELSSAMCSLNILETSGDISGATEIHVINCLKNVFLPES